MSRLATTLAAAALLLSACGGSGGDGADVAFAQQMVPHHEQAVEMSDLALDPARGASAEVRDLATRIDDAQQPEIDTMEGWLEEWGADDEHGSHGDGDHDMAGMMSADQMAELGSATGATFDRLWLTLMIEHHEGAVDMAEAVLADGDDPEVADLARAVVRAQQAEITEMKELLDA